MDAHLVEQIVEDVLSLRARATLCEEIRDMRITNVVFDIYIIEKYWESYEGEVIAVFHFEAPELRDDRVPTIYDVYEGSFYVM
jgi:hypothetical protein